MNRRIDHHGRLIGIVRRNFFIHLKKVAVFFRNDILPVPGLMASRKSNTPPDRFPPLLCPKSHWALAFREATSRGTRLPKLGYFSLQVIIPFGSGILLAGQAVVSRCFGHPDPAVISKALAHERQLGLIGAVHRNAGGVNLGKARVGEKSALCDRPGRPP